MGEMQEIHSILKENGFWERRRAKHGAMWTDGVRVIMVQNRFGDIHAIRNLRAEITRAVLRRSQEAATKSPKVTLGEGAKVLVETQTQSKPEVHSPWANIPTTHPTATSAGTEFKAPPGFRIKMPADLRKQVRARIAELSFQGHKNARIAEIMASEGFKGAAGKPVNMMFVANQKWSMAKAGALSPRRKNAYLKKQGKTNGDTAPKVMETPIGSFKVSASAPIENVTSAKLPDAVINVLTDPQLSDAQKVRMLTAWVG